MYLSRRFNRSLAPPDRVSLNVTLRCNLTCTMCTTCYDAPELTLTEIKGIIDQTADWGVEVFNPLGGEPFMRADIEEILSYAVQRGFYVTVTTNGTLISEKRAEQIAQIPSDKLHFNISLDGDELANDEIRSAGMWSRAIQGLKRIRDADQKAGNARRKILSNTILHARNLNRFHDILDEQEALGFDGVQILNLFRQTDDVPAEAAALWFHADQIPALRLVTESLAVRAEKQAVVGYRIQNSPDNLRRIPEYYASELKPLNAPCWAGWKELYINADGQAIMCDGHLDFLRGGFGNAREQTLKQLWASPELRRRRETVRQCTTPCVQDCYLREDSDSASKLAKDATLLAGKALLSRAQQLRPTAAKQYESSLRMELTDVCPCDWHACDTPRTRWMRLIENVPGDFRAEDWGRYRDAKITDFGRGFMGFDVIRRVVGDLQFNNIRFSDLAVRWRGEPLLHPEALPILHYLLGAIADDTVARRLVIETDARFLTEDIASLSALPGSQVWILDGDRSERKVTDHARRLLTQFRHRGVQVITTYTAGKELDLSTLSQSSLPIRVGDLPSDRDAVWIRRASHEHYLADQAASAALLSVAESLGLSPPQFTDNRPTAVEKAPMTPIISWDGKVTLNPSDRLLARPVGDVVHSTLSAAWAAHH